MKQNNLRTFILFLSLVYSAIAFGASNNADSVYICSLVVDDFTGEVIGNASVRVLIKTVIWFLRGTVGAARA